MKDYDLGIRLLARFVQGETLATLAEEIGVSSPRIRQRINEGVRKLFPWRPLFLAEEMRAHREELLYLAELWSVATPRERASWRSRRGQLGGVFERVG